MSEVEERLPADVQAAVDGLVAADREASALLADLDEAQASWSPGFGAWSVVQCIDHLARINGAYLPPLGEAASAGRRAGWTRQGPIRPGPLERVFLWATEPPSRLRAKAPGVTRPSPARPKDEALGDFLRSQEALRALLVESVDLDLNRIRFRNPFVAGLRFRLGTAFLIAAAHDRRHLQQARRVTTTPGFPKP